MKAKHLLYATAVVAAVAAPSAAYADIMFSTGNTGGIGEVNIIFGTPQTGTSITGQIDHTGINATFSTLTGQTLMGQGSGQSDIQALPTPGTTLMTSIEMKAQAGTAWTDAIIDMDDASNPCGGGQGTCGMAKVSVTDQMGAVFTTTLQNGTNFVTMIAGLNAANVQEFITDIQVTEAAPDPTTGVFGWIDFKQPRVSGLCTLGATGCQPVPVSTPEPTSLALLGSALMGLGALVRRRRRM